MGKQHLPPGLQLTAHTTPLATSQSPFHPPARTVKSGPPLVLPESLGCLTSTLGDLDSLRLYPDLHLDCFYTASSTLLPTEEKETKEIKILVLLMLRSIHCFFFFISVPRRGGAVPSFALHTHICQHQTPTL